MLRIARERISALFVLAGTEAAAGEYALSDRYVALARRIGTRYNVRLLPEFRELYCRRCSAYWVEGRTVRTRLRHGRRVRACLLCGSLRRVPIHPTVRASPGEVEVVADRGASDDSARVAVDEEEDDSDLDGGGAEEE
jgi:ribonuclease P protein subunit RPR2